MEDREQQRCEQARARVTELKGFYTTHETAFVLGDIGLFFIDLLRVAGGSSGRSQAGA